MANSKILTLSLNKKWFNMIKSGQKREEYREIKPYWKVRLRNAQKISPLTTVYSGFKKFDKVVFTLAYPKANDNERRLEFKNPHIYIGKGHPEWGAEPNKLYFVITWRKNK